VPQSVQKFNQLYYVLFTTQLQVQIAKLKEYIKKTVENKS